jgi:hypothetical protein
MVIFNSYVKLPEGMHFRNTLLYTFTSNIKHFWEPQLGKTIKPVIGKTIKLTIKRWVGFVALKNAVDVL